MGFPDDLGLGLEDLEENMNSNPKIVNVKTYNEHQDLVGYWRFEVVFEPPYDNAKYDLCEDGHCVGDNDIEVAVPFFGNANEAEEELSRRVAKTQYACPFQAYRKYYVGRLWTPEMDEP